MARPLGLQIKGLPQLQRRLSALEDLGPVMRDLALDAIGEQKRLSPVRTGNLRRTIHLGRLTARSAETIAGANYAAYVEFGTAPHEIRPRSKRVLRWKDGTGSYRYAASVQHPGTKAQPFMVPGAEAAIAKGGLKDQVIAKWNDAA